jgi:branched-chain amino acid transport system ATP-binding protein
VVDAVLQIENLHVSYGGSRILQGASLVLGSEPLAIVGRNGMGKTTLCQAIMGLAPSTHGRIRFKGEDLTGRLPYQIARRGIGYVPQGRRVFPSLNVDEHLRLAAKAGQERLWTIDAIYQLFPRLKERRRNGGAQLSGGEQQMLAISRALLLNPDLIVMDEPTEGLAPIIVEGLVDVFRTVSRSGVAVLLVEQNLMFATTVAERLGVMVNGVIALNTTSAVMLADEALQRRYLGVSAHAHPA